MTVDRVAEELFKLKSIISLSMKLQETFEIVLLLLCFLLFFELK